MKTALLVIDLQKAYYKDMARESMDRAAATINEALALFRAKGLPVVWVQHIDEDDEAIPGKPGFDFIDGLAKRREGELSIHKTYNDSFTKTELAETLAKLGVGRVALSGYCAEYCVIATYWGARSRDFRSFILRGGIASDGETGLRCVEAITATADLVETERLFGEGS